MFASQLIYDQFVCCQKKIGIGDIVQRFQTTDFLFHVLRTIGITAVYYGILFAWFIVCFVPLALILRDTGHQEMLQTFPILAVLGVVIIFLLFLLFCISRLSLAVPLTVVENKKILESLKRSWRMTASCWIKISIIIALTGMLTLAVLVLFGLSYLAYLVLSGSDPNDRLWEVVQWSYIIFGYSLPAIMMSVCYCYLRSAKDRENNPPELNASD